MRKDRTHKRTESEKRQKARKGRIAVTGIQKKWTKAWILVAIIICVLATLMIGLVIVSHATYHRSVAATICERVLSLTKNHSTEQEIAEKLTLLKQEEEPVYEYDQYLFTSIKEDVFDNLKVFTMNENETSPIVIYLHGGAYVREINFRHWSMLRKIYQESGCEIKSIVYPLAPWHTWKDSYSSITNYYLKIKKENPKRKVFLFGDSAGGGLALGVTINIANLLSTNQSIKVPDGLILISPWVDPTGTNPEISDYEKKDPRLSPKPLRAYAKAWAGNNSIDDWHISPINGNLSKLKNVHIFVGTREILYPDAVRLYKKLKKLGVKAHMTIGKSLNHDFPLYPIPEADEALQHICAVLQAE